MKTLDTLVQDIQELLVVGKDSLEHIQSVEEQFSNALNRRLIKSNDEHILDRGGLRVSNIGVPCERQLWYKVNTPDNGEALTATTLFKFFYGDIIELVVLGLAKEAGHSVTGEQEQVEILGIKGHRDAVIDGVTVDVKSASTMSFKKFNSGLQSRDDSFGYLSQLKAYVYAGRNDPKVVYKNKGAFLVVDKQHGNICLDVHTFTDDELDMVPYEISKKKEVVANALVPKRGFKDEEDGKSGNRKLGTNCSYCEFKHQCYPNLRTFLYSSGPRFLTKVARVPDVHEMR